MPATLANVELTTATTALCRWVERHIPVGEAFPWLQPSWPGHNLDTASVGVPGSKRPSVLKLNEFTWPGGASRWAYGCFLASSEQGEKIRAKAFGADGVTPTPVPLKLASAPNASESLNVQVTVLIIKPLTQLLADEVDVEDEESVFERFVPNNLVLLVVVDARYFWQTAACPDFAIGPYGSYNPPDDEPSTPPYPSPGNPGSSGSGGGSTGSGGGSTGSTGDEEDEDEEEEEAPEPPSWKDLIDALAAELGATIAVDEIPAAYLFPDPAFNLHGAPAALILDAVLANVGLRLVANYDGTFRAMNFANSLDARTTDDESEAGRKRTLRAGGDAFADRL